MYADNVQEQKKAHIRCEKANEKREKKINKKEVNEKEKKEKEEEIER